MSRENIIKLIQKHKPEPVKLPEIHMDFFAEEVDIVKMFQQNVNQVGGRAIEVSDIEEVGTLICKFFPEAKTTVSHLENVIKGTFEIKRETKPQELQHVDLAILKGELAVAENGAVWLSEKHLPFRVLPFIARDLVLIVSKRDLVLHMHEAYGLLAGRQRSFGLFISGPSKTADIEQCLVIGAQGAMSLTVFIV